MNAELLSKCEDAVMAYARKVKGGVSFVEIEQVLEELIPISGEVAMELDTNLFIWGDVSAEFSQVLRSLCNKKLLTMELCETLVYWVDGKCLNFPVAKRPPKDGYKTPHWLPVAFNLGVQA